MNYEKIYKNIVSKAQSRDKLDGYTERHHIIPKSLGGTDDDSNMVTLTAREHFLAHYCLWKFNEGQAKRLMAFAFRCMGMNKHGVRYMNSRLYSEFKKDLKHSEETKIKIGLFNKGRKHTQEHINKALSTKAKNRAMLTPADIIAKRLAQRVAYWKERELLESTT